MTLNELDSKYKIFDEITSKLGSILQEGDTLSRFQKTKDIVMYGFFMSMMSSFLTVADLKTKSDYSDKFGSGLSSKDKDVVSKTIGEVIDHIISLDGTALDLKSVLSTATDKMVAELQISLNKKDGR